MFYQQLVQPLINSNMNVNLGVLETAHSIFYSSVRARALYRVPLVHSKFLVPYFQLSRCLSSSIWRHKTPLCADSSTCTMTLHVRILPQSSRTAMRRSSLGDLVTSCSLWRGSRHSSRQMYVVDASHSPVPFARRLDVSHVQPDEPTPSLPSKVRTGVIEIAKVRLARPLSSAFSFD